MQSSNLVLFFAVLLVSAASCSPLDNRVKREASGSEAGRINNYQDGADFDVDDLLEGLKVYRNLALSRLVKKASETARYTPIMASSPEGAYLVAGRSGSRTPELSALWKTRVG